MIKKTGVSKLKKDLWKLFSLYIKRKHSIDHNESKCYCYTCGSTLIIGTSNCQAGHWLTKKGYPFYYFHEDNVRPQCYHCNINLGGNVAVFEFNLRGEIGSDTVNSLFEKRHTLEKRTVSWYLDKIEEYKGKLEIH